MCLCAPGLLKTSNQPNCTNKIKANPGSSEYTSIGALLSNSSQLAALFSNAVRMLLVCITWAWV